MQQPDDSPSRAAGVRLFLLGFATLFLELTLIRYLAGNIYNFGYFPNLVLLGVFIGMGIGFMFHHFLDEWRSRWILGIAIFVLLFLTLLVYFDHPVVPGFTIHSANIGGEVYFSAGPREAGLGDMAVFAILFFTIVLLFAMISQRTAKYFRRFPPLTSYTLDILGSCCGILSFMLISWLQLPAWIWFAALVPIVLLIQEKEPRNLRLALCFPLPIIAVFVWQQDARLLAEPDYEGMLVVRWSPYQKVEFAGSYAEPKFFVNGIGHQTILPSDLLSKSFYQMPHWFAKQKRLPPYKSVLVLGAGSGNDVTAALQNGAEHVDAVEIDPVIARLGTQYNAAHPYQDKRVSVVVDDGRAFMANANRKYDLIIFALTDSLVKVSPMAQLRLENYLFTKESVERAFRLLNENGFLVFYNFYRFPFIPEKIQMMVKAATGIYPITIFKTSDFSMIMVGRHYRAKDDPQIEAGLEAPTDDWPFLYLRRRGIPGLYVKAMAALASVIILLAFLLHYSSKRRREQEHTLYIKLAFVFMGIAFLLLETKSVIQFSLLFGTTWLNNSLVFLAVLLFVLVANWTARLLPERRVVWVSYLFLMGFCSLALWLPLGKLLSVSNTFWRFVLACIITFSPIFFANLIFSVTFRDRKLAEHLFGWNLIGAALGGILEYTSLALGYNALAVLVALAYSLVFALLLLERRRTATLSTAENLLSL